MSNIIFTMPFSTKGGVYSFSSTYINFTKNKYKIIKRGKIFKWLIYNSYLKFIYYCFNKKNDIVFINTSLNIYGLIRDGLYIYISKLFNKKSILYIHGFNSNVLKKSYLLVGYKKSNIIFVLSEKFKTELINFGFNNRIYITSNPIPNRYFSEFNIKESNSKSINLLFLSRVEKDKGIIKCIKILKNLINQNKDIHLHIAGDGNYLNISKNYVSSHNLNNYVTFYGFIDINKKIELLKKCNFFLLPTKLNEGLPISILEAIGAGIPVLTSNVGGISSFLKEDYMGYFCNTDEEYSNKILFLLNNKEKYKFISEYNINYAKNNLYDSIVINKIESIIESI